MLETLKRVAFEDRDIGQQQLAQRPHKRIARARGIPVGYSANHQAPLAQITSSPFFP